MINVSDPLERLRAANPVPIVETTLSPPDIALFHRITSGEPAGTGKTALTPARPRRRGRRFVPALIVSSLLGGAVAYALLRDDVSKPQTVACYEEANLRSPTEVAVVTGDGPLVACADLWRRGVFGDGGQVPDLAVCVLDSGFAAVFPTSTGPGVCAQVNLPPVATTTPSPTGPVPPPAAPADVNARVLAFRDAIFPQFIDAPCVEPRAAAAIVRRELDRAGLADWTIRGGEGLTGDGFSAERPCTTLSLRPESREVILVPTPRR